MELQLESEFQGMMRAIDRHEIDTSRLGALIDDVTVAAHEMHLDAATDSRLPGGSAAHGATARVVKRHITPLAESVRDLGTTVGTALMRPVGCSGAESRRRASAARCDRRAYSIDWQC